MKKILVVLSLLSFMFTFGVMAQGITMTMPSVTATKAGAPVSIPIKVTNFNNVGAISLEITYNSAVMTYRDISGAPSGFIVNGTVPGTIRLGWYDGTGNTPLNIGSATLLVLNFSYVGGTGSYAFTTANCEIANGVGTPYTVTYQNGILYTVPAAPTGLLVVATSQTRIVLSWGTVSGATKYTVYQDGTDISGSITTNNYAAAVSCGTTYSYCVTAGNDGGWSGASSPVSGTSNACTPTTCTISASAGSGGTISPSGSVSVDYGGSQTFTITHSPVYGYYTINVWVNGVAVGAVSSYTFSNVTSNQTIYASFASWIHKQGGDNQVVELHREFALSQNVPNPFNPTTVISYQLPGVGTRFIVSLKIYDMLGREVATLVDDTKEAGFYEATFNASHLSSGMFFARLVAQSDEGKPFVQTIKLLLMKQVYEHVSNFRQGRMRLWRKI